MGTPFLHKLGQKMVIFRSFSKNFSELPEIPINVFNIEFYNIFHWKPAKKNQSGFGLGAKFGPN